MSFWPFNAQNINSTTNLNRLLDIYYQHRIIPASQNNNNANEISNQTLSPLESNKGSSDELDSNTLTLCNSSNNLVLDTCSTSTSEYFEARETCSDSESQTIKQKIDRDFVFEVLDDVSLLTELNNQNNRVIDFLCFGYINELKQQDQINVDEDGDVKTIHEELTTLKSNNINMKKPNGTSILEVLVDIIVDSIDWFDENETFLFNTNEDIISDQGKTKQEEITILFNRIHVASEILSSKIWLISESVVEEQSLLTKLWSFLHQKTKDSSPAIQYFIKINEQLLDSRPDQMLNFIRSQKNLVDDFIKHIDITIIMDFLLRIITTDKIDIPTGIIDLLSEQGLIPKLLKILLTPDLDASTQSSTGDFLKALISISANTSIDENTIGPNLLTKELVNESNVKTMIQIIKNRGNGLSTIVGVIIEIIRKNNSDYDAVNLLYTNLESHPPSKRDAIYLGTLLRLFSESLIDFNDILIDSKLCSKRYLNQIQIEFEPLGFERFKVSELIAELLHCSNITLLNHELTESILKERENMLRSQQDNLANALNDILENDIKPEQANPSSFLNIPGTAEPSVALNADNITSNQTPNGFLPLHELSSKSEEEEELKPIVVGDVFKYQLIKSGILKTIISMFIQFPWNNFWHNVVFDIVQQIFNGKLDGGFNPYLILELFSVCDITTLIINSYKLCQDTERVKGFRLGYMGHLVLIAEEVVKFSAQFHSIPFSNANTEQLIYDKLTDQAWVNYVTNVLTTIREQYNCVLGGIKTHEDFEQTDHLNKNVIILGNSPEEILNQPILEEVDEEMN